MQTHILQNRHPIDGKTDLSLCAALRRNGMPRISPATIHLILSGNGETSVPV